MLTCSASSIAFSYSWSSATKPKALAARSQTPGCFSQPPASAVASAGVWAVLEAADDDDAACAVVCGERRAAVLATAAEVDAAISAAVASTPLFASRSGKLVAPFTCRSTARSQ